MSSARAKSRPVRGAAAWTLLGAMVLSLVVLSLGLTGCKQDVPPVERTLLVIESEEIAAEEVLTHLLLAALVEGSQEEPVLLLNPDDQEPWFELTPGSPPLHLQTYVIDLSEVLPPEEFANADVRIGVKGYHWPQPLEGTDAGDEEAAEAPDRLAIAGGQVVVGRGFMGTVNVMLTRDQVASVPEASCIPEAEACDGIDNDCDGDTDEQEDIDEVEVCDGADNDCDGQVDEEVTCDDSIPCTVDTCEPGSEPGQASCQHVVDNDLCFNAASHDPCAPRICDTSSGGCRSIIDPVLCPGCESDAGCENDNPCVNVSCHACSGSSCPPGFPGRCEASPLDSASCSDGNLCTQGDTCQAGICTAGPAKACDDGITCTMPSCSPETGACTFTAKDSLCDDGEECTEDICSVELGGCSVNLGDACDCETEDDCPDDLNPCTSNVCVAGSCVSQPKADDAICELSGSNPCIIGATCDGQGACTATTFEPGGTACDDGDPCTAKDSCAGVGGLCEGVPPVELCNGQDDDCDDKVDEDFTTVGDACDGDDGDACKEGTNVCTEDGAIVCSGDDADSSEEDQCNGLDEDCDGEIDETFLDLGMSCDEGGSGEGQTSCSVWVCDPEAPTELACDPAVDPNGNGDPEICNSQDDDCDGAIDEGIDCGSSENCTIELILGEEAGGKGGGSGGSMVDIMALTQNAAGSAWASALVMPDGSMGWWPSHELRKYTFSPASGELDLDLKVASEADNYVLATDYSAGSDGVLMAYGYDPLYGYETLSFYDPFYLSWTTTSGGVMSPDVLLPLYFDNVSLSLEYLVLNYGYLYGGSAITYQSSVTEWPPPSGQGGSQGAPLWDSGTLTTVAWNGLELLALSDASLYVCPGDTLQEQQLPTVCKQTLMPNSQANTIVVDPASFQAPGQWILVAQLDGSSSVVHRVDLGSSLTVAEGWFQVNIPGAAITHLSVFSGTGWALDSSANVTAFDVKTGAILASYALSEQDSPMALSAGKSAAYVAIKSQAPIAALSLVCQ